MFNESGRADCFIIDYNVMTTVGEVIVVRWNIGNKAFMVTGANLVEAMRAAVLLEEDRANAEVPAQTITVTTGGM